MSGYGPQTGKGEAHWLEPQVVWLFHTPGCLICNVEIMKSVSLLGLFGGLSEETILFSLPVSFHYWLLSSCGPTLGSLGAAEPIVFEPRPKLQPLLTLSSRWSNSNAFFPSVSFHKDLSAEKQGIKQINSNVDQAQECGAHHLFVVCVILSLQGGNAPMMVDGQRVWLFSKEERRLSHSTDFEL